MTSFLLLQQRQTQNITANTITTEMTITIIAHVFNEQDLLEELHDVNKSGFEQC